ncbi:aminopeptidase [Piscirickettsia salmonis]|nr:aminopeptidase [Piscirickettsia salmonis LF-89 = ATCC VR-1361]ALY02752.1 aminopeptidase [Piscirickettsia salmonis]AMA42298.1 aminopeptidase [Piscirickettsia salmonis]AOS34773.1 aminopeptidase [Piscirickettsia salmonis]APS59483.1 aminopeptidase [Piscirickettsia salmonis]
MLMNVILTTESPKLPWQSNTLVSIENDQAFIHIKQLVMNDYTLRDIQKAGRKLASWQLAQLQCAGSHWDLESQWAFYQGVSSPKGKTTLHFTGLEQDKAILNQLVKVSHWIRTTTNRTPSDLPPTALAEEALHFITECSPKGTVNSEIIQGDALIEAGLNGTYAVGKGSNQLPAILKLHYRPTSQEETQAISPTAALVGKGITFDSGGYSLKQSTSMLGMKSDMGGAALITGGLALAILQGLDQPVDLYLCCAENMVSDRSYRLGDIINYRNGLNVEVVNTDAEGRLVLADGLILAAESGAPLIIDAATLTGGAARAVGPDYNAVMALDKALSQKLLTVAESVNEAYWPLPLEPFHKENTPSAYTDTANSKPIPGGGNSAASNAAGFLSRFVPNEGKGWLHLDIAGRAFMDSANSLYAAGATAHGFRTIAKMLLS